MIGQIWSGHATYHRMLKLPEKEPVISMMNKDDFPKVAVLMAAYNGMQWIEEQVNSILGQKNVHVTLFVSVDLSTDGTEQWVQSLARKCENVFILPYGERFGGAGPNFFRLLRDVNFSCFDAVAFADQDDVWFSDKLHVACSLVLGGGCDVYSSNVTAFWPNGKQILIEKAQPQKRFDYFFEAAGPGCTYVFHVEAASAFKSFLNELGERVSTVSLHDWLAYAFCRDRGFVWHIDKKSSMLYRQHNGNQVGTNTGLAAYQRRIKLIKQKWFYQQVVAIAEVVAPHMLPRLRRKSFLLRNFCELRRRPRDRLFFLFIVLWMGLPRD